MPSVEALAELEPALLAQVADEMGSLQLGTDADLAAEKEAAKAAAAEFTRNRSLTGAGGLGPME